ncbi:MAG TPA: DUF1343 domain-containing protein, partial [Gemmatimonadales bacterium]
MRQLRPFLWIALAGAGMLSGAPPVVRPGIDVLLTDSIGIVTGRRVGLLTNQTGVDQAGVGDLERLLAAHVNVTAIFSPEHGYRGTLNRENIGNTVDSATGIPIYSLYGALRAPTPAMLAGVDVLLIDLQDIGARTYTYVSTALLAMRAVHDAGGAVRVVVLDRPNPIGGVLVQGPGIDTAAMSFVGALVVPMRHGMTLGELATFGNQRLAMGASLTVVPAAGWRRDMWLDRTGLPWIDPSPNMPSLASATLYPGLVLLEGTRVSVGRGTPLAFQVFGAPWLDPGRVRAAIGQVPGVALRDTTFVPRSPSDGKFGGQVVRGFRVIITNRTELDPTRLGVRVLAALWRVYRDTLRFDDKGFDRLAGGSTVRTALRRGEDGDAIWRSWAPEVERFR